MEKLIGSGVTFNKIFYRVSSFNQRIRFTTRHLVRDTLTAYRFGRKYNIYWGYRGRGNWRIYGLRTIFRHRYWDHIEVKETEEEKILRLYFERYCT